MPATNVELSGPNVDGLFARLRLQLPLGTGDLVLGAAGGWVAVRSLVDSLFIMLTQLNNRSAPLIGEVAPDGVVTAFRGQLFYRTTTGQWYANTSTESGSDWTAFPG